MTLLWATWGHVTKGSGIRIIICISLVVTKNYNRGSSTGERDSGLRANVSEMNDPGSGRRVIQKGCSRCIVRVRWHDNQK